MPIDAAKLHEIATKYDPLPVLQAMEELSKQEAAKKSGPPIAKSIEQSLMQPAAQPQSKGPWG